MMLATPVEKRNASVVVIVIAGKSIQLCRNLKYIVCLFDFVLLFDISFVKGKLEVAEISRPKDAKPSNRKIALSCFFFNVPFISFTLHGSLLHVQCNTP